MSNYEDEKNFLFSQFPNEIRELEDRKIEFHRENDGESLVICFDIEKDYPNAPPKYSITSNENLKKELEKQFESNIEEFPEIPFFFFHIFFFFNFQIFFQ